MSTHNKPAIEDFRQVLKGMIIQASRGPWDPGVGKGTDEPLMNACYTILARTDRSNFMSSFSHLFDMRSKTKKDPIPPS